MKEAQKLQLLELVKKMDEAIHRSMPVGGNANHEAAQQLCNQLRKEIEEAK